MITKKYNGTDLHGWQMQGQLRTVQGELARALSLIDDSFVFSSRRRHTRWNCDWSSDVCSSDLTCGVCRYCRAGRENLCDAPLFTGYTRDGGRSEERRVGKECRSRWAAYDYKKIQRHRLARMADAGTTANCAR